MYEAMHMRNRKMLLMIFITISNVLPILSSNITTVSFDNGCVLRHATKESSGKSLDFTPEKPFLNCSGQRKTSFNLTANSFPTNIRSISFQKNQLKYFNVDDLAKFSSLTKLNLGFNKISNLLPSSRGTSFELIKTLDIRNNSLKSVPSAAFSSFSDVTALDISNNLITQIKDDDFKNLTKLKLIRMGGNQFTQISETAFQRLSSSLHAVSIPLSGLSKVPGCLTNLPVLVWVSLMGNRISSIPKNAFAGDKSLRWLEMDDNKIKIIDRNAFAGLEKLEMLDLSENLIETLPVGVFDGMTTNERLNVEMYENPISCNCSMKWLRQWIDSLDYKDIRFTCSQPARNHGKSWSQLDPGDFTCRNDDYLWKDDCSHVLQRINKAPPKKAESRLCPVGCKCYNSTGDQYYPRDRQAKRLKKSWWFPIEYPYVDCSNAGYRQLPLSTIRNDVKTLNFIKNKFQNFRIRDLRKFTLATIIYLENSGIVSLYPDGLTKLGNVRYLSLQHNNIKSISHFHLKSFPNVKVLRLSNNKISTFQQDMFSETRLIRRLYLGPNPATNFQISMVYGLDLQALSLRNLSLTAVPKLNFWNLTYLEISDNFITTVPNNTFAGTPNIARMGFDNNRITYIGSFAFNNCSRLKNIDLSENMLERLPVGVFNPLFREELQIELWMNPIVCDCRMKWFKQWIEQVEEDDPSTDIRFLCKLPWRTYGKTSDALSSDQFTCHNDDRSTTPTKDHFDVLDGYYEYKYGMCHNNGQMALAILLTMIFTASFTLCIKWCHGRRRRRYHKPDSDIAPLAMEE